MPIERKLSGLQARQCDRSIFSSTISPWFMRLYETFGDYPCTISELLNTLYGRDELIRGHYDVRINDETIEITDYFYSPPHSTEYPRPDNHPPINIPFSVYAETYSSHRRWSLSRYMYYKYTRNHSYFRTCEKSINTQILDMLAVIDDDVYPSLESRREHHYVLVDSWLSEYPRMIYGLYPVPKEGFSIKQNSHLFINSSVLSHSDNLKKEDVLNEAKRTKKADRASDNRYGYRNNGYLHPYGYGLRGKQTFCDDFNLRNTGQLRSAHRKAD